MHRIRWIGIISAAAAAACGGHSVLVPPRVDLAPLARIGIIQFVSDAQGNLAPYATERYLEMIRRGQGMVPIVEIGTREDALKAVGATTLDLEALKAIGQKYGVQHIILGNLDVSKVRPHVHVSLDPSGVSGVTADMTATLTTKIVECATGATVWNGSASRQGTVGYVEIFGTHVGFNARDPDRAYGELITPLVKQVTRDFQPTYERR